MKIQRTKHKKALTQWMIFFFLVCMLIGCKLEAPAHNQPTNDNPQSEVETTETPKKDSTEDVKEAPRDFQEEATNGKIDDLVKEETDVPPEEKVDESLPDQKDDGTQNNIKNPSESVYPTNPCVAQWYPDYVDVEFSNVPENAGTKTLFAPGVSLEAGWYDTNKSWTNDTFLCWAASSTNAITWWLDRYQEGGGDVSGIEVSSEKIFQTFINNWENTGYDEKDGVCWYFTGKFSAGRAPSNLKNPNSGGFLKHLPGIGSDAWCLLDITDFSIFGNPDNKRPFFDYQMGSYFSNQPLYSLESFSRTIIRQLSMGMVLLKVTGLYIRGEHAITLWGCDYDGQTGLVSHVYITDSDDHRKELRRMAISPSSSGRGVEMLDYYVGNDRFGGLADAILLFPPVEFSKTK